MSCAARAFIGPRNDPSVSGSDEEVFVLFLFPLPVHTDVSCCVGWHLLLVINMLLCFFNRISDQFYNLTYVRELTALESAAHLTVLIFTVTVRMCLCLITCS